MQLRKPELRFLSFGKENYAATPLKNKNIDHGQYQPTIPIQLIKLSCHRTKQENLPLLLRLLSSFTKGCRTFPKFALLLKLLAWTKKRSSRKSPVAFESLSFVFLPFLHPPMIISRKAFQGNLTLGRARDGWMPSQHPLKCF